MILQGLVRLYEDLVARGDIAGEGWAPVKISYAVCIDELGDLQQLIPLVREVTNGKKTILRPQEPVLPAPVKRSSGIAPNFLWENAEYLFGRKSAKKDEAGKKDRSADCFAACRVLHHEILDGTDSECAKAILAFFDKWKPENAVSDPILAVEGEKLEGVNLLFRINGMYPQDDPMIREAWSRHYSGGGDGQRMQCLVTGEVTEIAQVHPAIKGVRDAQSSGAAIVSFNAPAFCSYGRQGEQGLNAPIGRYAAFAYTAAVNHLLADTNNVQRIGDTSVVCWAEGAEPQYTGLSLAALFGSAPPAGMTENDLRAAVRHLAHGEPVPAFALDPERQFFVLGLAPNAARLSVRFFLRDTFGSFMKHAEEHYDRLEIERPAFDTFETLPLWKLLAETVNQKSQDKKASPVMAGAMLRSVLTGGLYPASLLEQTMVRLRAEREISRGKAAILKAYYLKNTHPDCPKEVLTVGLNETTTNVPYVLGRLFCVYEKAQQRANPGINATIKDKYFNSAAATPAVIFPVLNSLYQKHLRKMEHGTQVFYDKQVCELNAMLGEEYPTRMSLPEQGSFYLGYYHQNQKFFTKKED